MTNEEIVMRIRGGDDALMETLLSRNQKYIRTVAQRYHLAAIRNRGCDEDDLIQAATLGMIETVGKWDASRGAFLTVATLYMKKHIRSMLGIHSSKRVIENEIAMVSLHEPVSDEPNSEMLIHFIQDEDATCPLDAVIRADTCRIVRDAVNGLPVDERNCIHAKYFGDISVEQVGGTDAVRVGCRRGISRLRNNRSIRALLEPVDAAPYRHEPLSTWRHTGTSSVEWAVLRRERLINTGEDA